MHDIMMIANKYKKNVGIAFQCLWFVGWAIVHYHDCLCGTIIQETLKVY